MSENPIDQAEAEELAAQLIRVIEGLEQRKPSAAIPRDVLNSGGGERMAASFLALLVHTYPTIADPDVVELACVHFRPVN